MRENTFQELVLWCRKAWDSKDGLIVRIGKNEDDSDPLTICIGAMSNPGFVAQNCKVWKNDDLLYDGRINSPELRKLLNQHHVCHAEGTTVKLLDVKHGVYKCFGNSETCKKTCHLKACKTLQVGGTDIAIV